MLKARSGCGLRSRSHLEADRQACTDPESIWGCWWWQGLGLRALLRCDAYIQTGRKLIAEGSRLVEVKMSLFSIHGQLPPSVPCRDTRGHQGHQAPWSPLTSPATGCFLLVPLPTWPWDSQRPLHHPLSFLNRTLSVHISKIGTITELYLWVVRKMELTAVKHLAQC